MLRSLVGSEMCIRDRYDSLPFAVKDLLEGLTFAFASLDALEVEEQVREDDHLIAGEKGVVSLPEIIHHGHTADHGDQLRPRDSQGIFLAFSLRFFGINELLE